MRFLLSLLVLALATLPLPAQTSAPPARHLVVVSIDGLMPASYLHPEQYNLKIPNLRRLMSEGSYAAGVASVIPAVTYPSHATLATGVMPAVHGIYANPLFTDPTTGERKFQWEASRFRVRTLWDTAHEAGLTTAAIGWPATLGAPIDYHVPEVWDVRQEHGETDLSYAARFSTPGLVDAAEREYGSSVGRPLDESRTDVAVYVLRQHRPNLLLLHIYDLDTAEHDFGPWSPQALKALEFADRQVGRLIAAAEQAGISGETTFVVVSDHGFLPIRRDFNLGRLLADEGFIKRGGDGRVKSWSVFPLVMGGSAYLFLRQPADEANLGKLYRALESYLGRGSVGGIFSPAATKEMTGVEGAVWVEAGLGYRFAEGWTRPTVIEASRRNGYHGFLPYHAGMDASFIAAGAGIRNGVRLPVIRMTAVAPTLAALLGIDLPQADASQTLVPILGK